MSKKMSVKVYAAQSMKQYANERKNRPKRKPLGKLKYSRIHGTFI